jgi:prophage antirepressor-like protein
MDSFDMLAMRATSIAKAIPLRDSVLRAEVLPTLRKHGLTSKASRPFQEASVADCLERGSD